MEQSVERTVLEWKDCWVHSGYICNQCNCSIPKGDVVEMWTTHYKKDGKIAKWEGYFLCTKCDVPQ